MWENKKSLPASRWGRAGLGLSRLAVFTTVCLACTVIARQSHRRDGGGGKGWGVGKCDRDGEVGGRGWVVRNRGERTGQGNPPRCVCPRRLNGQAAHTQKLSLSLTLSHTLSPPRSIGSSCTDAADESPTPRVSEMGDVGCLGAMQKLSVVVIFPRSWVDWLFACHGGSGGPSIVCALCSSSHFSSSGGIPVSQVVGGG